MASSNALYGRILSYGRRYVRLALLAVVCMVLAAATKVSFAWIVQPLIDGTFIERDPATRRWIPFGLVGLFLLHGLMQFASAYSVATVGKRVVRDLRQDLFGRYLTLPSAFFDKAAPGELLARLTYNVNEIANAAAQAVLILIRDTFTIIFLVGYMIVLSPWLTLITLAIGPPILIVINLANRRFRKTARRVQESVGQFAQVAEDSIRGQSEIKLFGTQAREAARFEAINERNRRQEMRYIAIKSIAAPATQFVAIIGLALVLFLATSDTVMETLSTGALLSFVTSMLLMLPSLKRIVTVNSEIQKALAAAESAFAILDAPPEQDSGDLRIDRAAGRVQFESVSFGYRAEAPVLREINLHIEPGQTVALVGRSGSGKSTLASLLPRLHDPDQGTILLDGQPLAAYRLDDLRRQIAMVSQQVVLFNDSVANNIAYGQDGPVDRVRLEAAARDANALDFIRALPDGFETLIGENGVMLSGGQRQRLAIARALMKDAPILVLDEATSALDTESERLIQDALNRLIAGRTTLVIAHRLSTIEHADLIAVLDDGAIVELGTHRELLGRGGDYARLHARLDAEPA